MTLTIAAWALIASALALYVRSAYVWHHHGSGGGLVDGNSGPVAAVGETLAVVVIVTCAAWLVLRRSR